jgi:hypothetical protein
MVLLNIVFEDGEVVGTDKALDYEGFKSCLKTMRGLTV